MSGKINSEVAVIENEESSAVAADGGGEADAQQGSGAAEAGAMEGSPSPGGEETAVAAQEEGDKEVVAYTPREKFKVLDTEHEVPALLKEIMKDADSEKQVIELLEKSYGLDPVKTKLAETRKERDTLKTEFGKLNWAVEDVRQTYQRGDIDGFLQKLNIPQERMLQWALEKVNYSQLPPEQQRMQDEHRNAQRQAWQAQQQASTFEQQLAEQNRQAKVMLLEAGLARPDVDAFQRAFDAKVGKPGAFKAEIVAQGNLAWVQDKVDLTPQQAIEKAMQKWAPFVSTQPAATGQAQSTSAAVVSKPKPNVIPNIAGKAQSPMKSQPESLEELKKLRDQARA